MKFSAQNKGEKFYFIDNNPDAGWVILRITPKFILDKIVEDTTMTIVRRGQKEVKENIPKQNREIWDYQIVDWNNVELDGKILECNIDNKEKMMNEVPGFFGFILERLNWLGNRELSGEEKAKNFERQSELFTKENSPD